MPPRVRSASTLAQRHISPFQLEQFYREHLSPADFDLSASSPPAMTSRECYEEAGIALDLADLQLGYELGGGSAQLKAAIAAQYEGVQPEEVLITAGALEAIRAVAGAVVERGMPVAIQTPSYGALRHAVEDLGGRPLSWRAASGTFRFRLQDLMAGHLAEAQVALINTPHGPSGSLLDESGGFPGFIVADEVYRPIELVEGTAPHSLIDTQPRSLVIGDLSKPLGLGGLRIGWIVCRDPDLLRECAANLDYLSGSVSALSARVASVALQSFPALLNRRLQPARRNLSHLAQFVQLHPHHIDWTPPQAGYTAFLRFRQGRPSPALFKNLKARGVFLLPGDLFDCPDHIRIGFGGEEEAFQAALGLLGDELYHLPLTTHSDGPAGDLILFTKAPWQGLAKTRLAMEIGDPMASHLAAAFISDTVAFCQRHSQRLFVSYTPAGAADEISRLAPETILMAQQGDDFGRRLASAFREAFRNGARNPVLIGSDSPSLPAHLLTAAHKALSHSDLVVGPAEDGGFYALGMSQSQPRLLEDIDWSADSVLDQLKVNAARLGLSIFWLPYWYDIDLVQDLKRLYSDPLVGSATAEVLRSLYGG